MKAPTKLELLLLELKSQQVAEELERREALRLAQARKNKEKADLMLQTIKMQLSRTC